MAATLQAVMWPVISVFALLGVGALVRRLRWIEPAADASMMRLLINVLMPCFVFGLVVESEAIRSVADLAAPAGVGFLSVVIGYAAGLAVAWLGGERIGLDRGERARTFALSSGVYNYGYIPYPLVAGAFAAPGSTLGVLAVHNLGVEIALWTGGLLLLRGRIDGESLKRAANPVSLSIVLGAAVNLSGLADRLPPDVLAGLLQAIELPGRAAIPLALVISGAVLCDEWPTLASRRTLPTALSGAALRLAALPAIFLAAAWSLPMSDELKRVVAVQAAMPAAIFPLVLAKHFEGHPPTAIRVCLGSSLLAIVTTPLWLAFGLRLLGLEAVGG